MNAKITYFEGLLGGGKTLLLRAAALLIVLGTVSSQAADKKLTPYHEVQAGVPAGTLTKYTNFTSKIFTNTTRDWWVYVPAQYQKDKPACVMVFQDGHDYVNLKGNWRVPTVFDNLIAKGEMPVTIGIFINPGHIGSTLPKSAWQSNNRSFEYDSLGDRYARFLVEEILPEVKKTYNITDDPEGRAISGASSGGICSFTVAWERPDQFRKVLSTIGSFVDLRGGHVYPYLIRKTEKKPIKVFPQDSSGDLDNPFGNWPLANQMMNSSLRYMKYDVKFDYVEGFGHNSDRGGQVFPDALKWLWEGYKK
jgi:enterochelin esterase family protein